MRRAVWGLPQAGILANKLLKKRLAPHGYHECKQTPGLWKHTTRPISFTLVVDDFGVKCTRKEDINHLIKAIKEKYELTKDWDGDLYCSICLKWDYHHRTLNISMPATSASSSKNTGRIAQNVPNTAHTLHCLNNMEVKPSVLSPWIHLPHYRRTISSMCSKSSEASSITLEPWTSPFSWPSAQSPANKQKVRKTP